MFVLEKGRVGASRGGRDFDLQPFVLDGGKLVDFVSHQFGQNEAVLLQLANARLDAGR